MWMKQLQEVHMVILLDIFETKGNYYQEDYKLTDFEVGRQKFIWQQD